MKSPGNFSFIDNFIAGSAVPQLAEELEFIRDKGIRSIISLTVEKPLITKYMPSFGISSIHLPIYSIPSDKQIKKYFQIIKNHQSTNHKLLVHCQFGQERTGIFLALYLIEFKGKNTIDAIQIIRDKRPKSLRTRGSLQFLHDYYCNKRN